MTPQHLDLDQIPDTPNRRAHHRRAQSETFIRFPDFDDDSFLDDVVFDLPPAPTLSSDTNSAPSQLQQLQPDQSQPLKSSEKAHFRSLSVDAGFFEGLYFGASSAATDGGGGGGGCVPASAGLVGPRHRYSSSMDGLAASDMTSSFEAMMVDSAKKADRLQELALIDPKKVKRILANRQSAARSKERKTRYTNELERKVQTLQTEATTLSAQVTMMQRDTTGLTAENKELKLRLQALEQQAHLRDALNEALREEIQRLRKATGHMPAGNGSNFNRGPPPQFSSQQPNFDQYCNQAKHDQQQPQQKIHMPHSTINNPAFNPQSKPSFLDFNQKA